MSLADELDIPESGAVFTFGKSHFADNEPSHFFIKNDPVVDIVCGDDHTAVICQQGRVFAFGSNSHGQLGLGHVDDAERPACVKWLKPRKAKQVACGRWHTLVLTENNQLFAAGDNAKGQLGCGTYESQPVPQFVEIPDEQGALVKEIVAGAEHTIVLVEQGKAYACGSNEVGQLGVGDDVKNSHTFVKIPFAGKIRKIACGYYYSVLITEEGEVYVFGDNENQRLGVAKPSSCVFEPTMITVGDKIVNASCGQFHTLLTASSGAIYALGSNEQGQLGLPMSVVEVNHPTEISFDKLFQDHKVVRVACGSTHSAFVTDDGRVYTCGDATDQKLCQEDNVEDMSNNNTTGTTTLQKQYIPKWVSILEGFHVNNVACGGHHTIISATKILTKDNNNVVLDKIEGASRTTPIMPDLPPLQKVPSSILKQQMEISPRIEEHVERPIEAELSDNGNETPALPPENFDKQSLDSLEPNVSGSHILEINDLTSGVVNQVENEAKITIENAEQMVLDAAKNVLARQQTVVEIIEKTVVAPPIHDEEVKREVELNEDSKSPGKHTLRVPDTVQYSPVMSIKSDVSQKSARSTERSEESDHETIICHSEKASPQTNKVSKTQAVIPILRSEESTGVIEVKDTNEENDVVQAKISKNKEGEGRISKFFSGLKNESCIGKSRVISSIDLKEQTILETEAAATAVVGDHTNSRTCIIL